MNIMLPKISVMIQLKEHPGFYYDIELTESQDGMIFAGWLYHLDYSIKCHIFSIEAIRNDDLLDWFTVEGIMSEYIEKHSLTTYYWQQVALLEEENI